MTRNAKSRVMTIANKLVGKGFSRKVAMLKAWILAKAERLSVRVAGVTFNNRQSVLKAICGKPAQVKLIHENNSSDINSVSVWAFAEGTRGFYRIGYLPRGVASVIAPLIDKGQAPKISRLIICGGFEPEMNFGARLQIAI